MDRERRPPDRLFLSFARSLSLEGARRLADADPGLGEHYDLDAIFSEVAEMRDLDASHFAQRYPVVAPAIDPSVRSFLLLFYLHHQQASLGLAELDVVEQVVRGTPGEAALDELLTANLRAYVTLRAGKPNVAVARLGELSLQSAELSRSIYGRYVQTLLLRNLGLACQRVGDFESAQRHLQESLALANSHRFMLVLSCNFYLASLLWASGQYREALARHLDPGLRELARTTGNHNQLLHSHIGAAKCSLDLKSTAAAAAELDAAAELLARTPDAWPEIGPYLLLHRGELAVQEEHFEKGVELLEEALMAFEELDPPHYPGSLDCKIALTHFALYEKDYRTAFALLRTLLAEAEARGCLEARSRLLVLEAFLYVTENPPLESAYQDLVSRVHLINNPALLFRALGNLYTYALEHLDESEQLFLLERIRNLEKVLDTSCYDDLYRRYITERYEYAIENRLARYVQEDWVTWEEEPE